MEEKGGESKRERERGRVKETAKPLSLSRLCHKNSHTHSKKMNAPQLFLLTIVNIWS
jgi:hypothetical protein